VYAVHDATDLREATERIQRRLGPQRTREALEAIEQQRWSDACMAMLAYYDGCYDRELERKPASSTIDLEGVDPKGAAELLVEQGVVTAMVCS
jgi:tRNA 2-selenouridine synthase